MFIKYFVSIFYLHQPSLSAVGGFLFLFSKEASGVWMVGWGESEGGIGDGRECGRRLGLRAALCQHRPCQVSGSQ